MAHPELPAEQAHVDHAYARLEAMRAAATGMLQEAFGERGGTFQSFTERDIRVRTSLSRLEQLQIGDEALVFGRIDRIGPSTNGEPGADETFHIGRLAISDADQEPLVVDWRAPVVEPFYRATGAHPMGLRRRRHFLTEGRRLLDLEDELFDEEGTDEGVGLGLSGSQVLLAALSRARTGRMRDIVATVQREQDEIIRGPLGGILVVQGGPGTGKTAVALHRAAYLLYTHRFPLESQGVLVVGPNPTFLRYIGHVLPSLGESGVELSTIAGLYSHATGRRSEDIDAARLKGGARMRKVIARAVADRQRPLRRTVEIPYGRAVLRLTPEASAQIVAVAKRRPGTHNSRRRTVENLLWRHLLEEVHRRIPAETSTPAELPEEYFLDDPPLDASLGDGVAPGAGAAGGEPSNVVPFARPDPSSPPLPAPLPSTPPADEGLTAAELGSELRRQPDVAAALDRMWPILTAEELLHDLFGARPLIDLAARSVLSDSERAALVRPRSASLAEVPWTAADIPLLDEARALLGPPKRRVAPDEPEDIRRFGHIVVDETQDLSPMQLRMLARRSLGGSMTVVGDIAQATGSWAPESWSEVVAHLPGDRGWRQVDLTVNYRTPAEIMDLARRVLAAAEPGMTAPDAVRESGEPVRFVPVDGPASAPVAAADGRHQDAAEVPVSPEAAPEAVAYEGEPAEAVPYGGEPVQASLFPPSVGGYPSPPAYQPESPARPVSPPRRPEPRRIDQRQINPGQSEARQPAVATSDDPGLVSAVVSTAGAELEALAGGAGGDGRLAVIAPRSLLEQLSAGLRSAGIEAGGGYGADLDAPAVLLAVEEAKGLEFDGVLVVEPSRIARESAQGLRAVYVALTRATRRLAVVHAEALPEALQPEGAGAAGGHGTDVAG
ncbi:AAA family ATPase [Acidiferrimicrobium sp. IK]|uniref:HelD family protein n=1 Tax=Acidiferrimicrobium sp. IK TaxID=2871700 RepID=UPI0021CB93C5|nr:AAA family ATPase [Acidiferrimicrobium sp. IK]MCU4186933.1 AAA family ATPase [Acidiferrimicrobium sp. IK]